MPWKVTIYSVSERGEHPLVYMTFDSQALSRGYQAVWHDLSRQAGVQIRIQEENVNANNLAIFNPYGALGAYKGPERRRPDDGG